MTCKLNEAVALNRRETKRLVEKNGVVALKADKSQAAPEADALLIELGNAATTLPFYAIYPADGRPPITFDGPITQEMVISALEEAGPSREIRGGQTAMK